MLRGAWEEKIADLGLTAPQAALLRAVAQRPGSGLRELARRAAAYDRLLASALGTAELARLQRLLDRLDAVLASGLPGRPHDVAAAARPRPQNGTGP
jgi:hypothetical protein